MVHFVGAGPGAPDLITVRGQALLKEADIIIYAGSLVNKELLEVAPSHCRIYNSALMTLEEVVDVMIQGEKEEKKIVRLHTGDPCLYGAIREQMDRLEEEGISYEVCPRRQQLLRSGGIPAGGIYPAGYFPDGNHYENGGQDTGTREGKAEKPGGPSKHHGSFPEHRPPGAGARRTAGRRPGAGYALCHLL